MSTPDKSFVSDDDKEKKKEKPKLASVSEVFSFAESTKCKVFIFLGFVFACITGLVFPAIAFLFADVLEKITSIDLEMIRRVVYNFMILGVIAFSTMSIQSTLMETAAGEMTLVLKTHWVDAILRQDMAYFDINDVSGEAILICSNGRKYRKGVGRKLSETLQYLITVVVALAYSFWASWRISLLLLATAPFVILALLIIVKLNESQTSRANATYAKAGSIVTMTVSSMRTILSLNALEDITNRFTSATDEAYHGAVSQAHLLGLAYGFMMSAMILSYVPVTLYGAYLLYSAVRKTGCDPSGIVPGSDRCDPAGADIFGALMGISIASSVLPQVSVGIEAFTGARAACYPAIAVMKRKVGRDDANDSFQRGVMQRTEAKGENQAGGSDVVRRGCKTQLPKYEIDSSSTDGKKPSKVDGEIEFYNVRFAYPTRREIDIFKEFSLKFQSGKTVALVGPSGGGKSTVINLLDRYYDPIEGIVTLDGIDLKDLNVKWLRQQIGLVSQEPNLFSTSIRENIALGCPSATDDQIEEAAKKAHAHDFIMSFPDGYNTQVGNKGAQLSGGQKQRIAIARVLVNNPKILLLDEATSALDSESERVVQEALDQLLELENKTTIVIAHRLSTIRNADLIAVVSEGEIAETGSYDELLAKRGLFYGLVEAQKGNTDKPSPDVEIAPEETTSVVTADEEEVSTLRDFYDLEEVPMLRFRDVQFAYPARPQNLIFHGLNLLVREGETLALVGPSGHGKSTIFQLIEHFYSPDRGIVEYKGVDMKDINTKWLRDSIGMVSQEPTVFDMTIEENIKFGCPNVTDKEIEQAARDANAHDFIASFPDGYQTQVGEGGTQISGGQKQRIAISRVLLRRPTILLLDEATSALDSESEKVVQEALDKIMTKKSQTTIVIAHRLSTIRKANRIAVVEGGKISEIGTHEELMSNQKGRYRRLQDLQNLDADIGNTEDSKKNQQVTAADEVKKSLENDNAKDEEGDLDAELTKKNAQRTRMLAKGDTIYFLWGSIGAIFAGLVFPAWGVSFAYLIEILYMPVLPCELDDIVCCEYFDSVANEMSKKALYIFLGIIGIMIASTLGNTLVFYAFGKASGMMNKRVRDSAFKSLVRQEIAWFDVRDPGSISSRLSDDAAMLQAFAGEPIRTAVISISSCLVGVVISFFFMWPFALLVMGIMPFMAFGAEAEMKLYMGEDEGDTDESKNWSGAILIEMFGNIRTVVSLTLEENRSTEYVHALQGEDPTPMRSNFVKGCSTGLGQFFQMWGMGLMFWWGGWLLTEFPNTYKLQDFMISMFSLLFCLYGLAAAFEGVTDREKAKVAAKRIFELIDRKSLIDPLSDEGKKDI